ncbi:MAG: 23S rRNA (guanosine(2251)-2'-O)-methyltransferase RlmB [Bosea sp. (in: a-proteobacteria)]|uniref:23S rRNA (guanosine(2251)-2'-O)-methyltransferase RlmB n=1 Tax=unclassified Bosea (in: a-proteobacteria) TaxID=2653178 RepID=UPI0009616801|nr:MULTISPECIES: 23S rRNA (guanosine(2251)-2'-O)-methyltransferase RlmB [unclassified Bosea (in: a-proteobacteria)]MBN9458993.1 23S rRNA (guanosine(2251)-2'-O)-methyltransferase RlmB [Bosea sp. (in: a-proteobacteria)]OJV06262.1 MAG: 23S rRNA (guanosine(2251)-2'-O)-methyltransferase RlmB [Bosea sp. 67-29]
MAPPFRPKQARPAGNRPGGHARRAGAPPPHRPGDIDEAVLYGVHPVVEALRNPHRRFRRLLATENALRRLREEIGDLPVEAELVRPSEIDRLLTPDSVHQGLYLVCEPLPSPDLDSLPDDAVVLALDQITDPHNVGAILRSAAAFGAAAVIVTIRHSPAATGVLAKSASGALEHVPLVAVRNLGDALETLGKRGFLRLGFDSEGDVALEEVALRRPLVMVMGAEGKGLRQRTRELCDHVARLEVPGAITSLNVSNATAIALYAASRRR